MMHGKFLPTIACLLILSLQMGTSKSKKVKVFSPERLCSSQGGLCVHESECSANQIAKEEDLCPNQKPNGAVCCSKIPDTWTVCQERGGECMARSVCPKYLSDELGTCESSVDVCCILV